MFPVRRPRVRMGCARERLAALRRVRIDHQARCVHRLEVGGVEGVHALSRLSFQRLSGAPLMFSAVAAVGQESSHSPVKARRMTWVLASKPLRLTLAFKRSRVPMGKALGSLRRSVAVPRGPDIAWRDIRRGEADGVADTPARHFVIAHQAGQDGQARGIGGTPAGGPQRVGVQLPRAAVSAFQLPLLCGWAW